MPEVKKVDRTKAIYSPSCVVCRWLKTNRKFKDRIFMSAFFQADGEPLAGITRDFGYPFSEQSVYRCMKDHKKVEPLSKVMLRKTDVPVLGEILATDKIDYHEETLDTIIREGGGLVTEGKLTLNMTQLLAAIKLKSDIVSKNKDRRLDAYKTLTGASGIGQPQS